MEMHHHQQLTGHESISAGSTITSTDWRHSRSTSTFNPSMQVSEPHYNYTDPSPSTFASPTNSSPSASPQAFEQRRHSATFPLFLAQHTSAAPITIEPLDAGVPAWQQQHQHHHQHQHQHNGVDYSPPLRYNFVPQTVHTINSMEYVPSPVSSYPYPPQEYGHQLEGGATVGIHRRRLSALSGYPFHMQHPTTHLYDPGYGMMMMQEQQDPYHHYSRAQPHFAAEQQQQHSWEDPSGFSRFGTNGSLDSHSTQQPLPPQLLLATTMPTSAPIVIDDSSIAQHNTTQQPIFHQYDNPSQTDLRNSPTHTFEVSTTTTTPIRSTLPGFPATRWVAESQPEPTPAYNAYPHSGRDDRYRTNMDICTEENTHQGGPMFTARAAPYPPLDAQPHVLLQADESNSMNPSPTHEQGQRDITSAFTVSVPIHSAVVVVAATGHEPSQDQQQRGGGAPAGEQENNQQYPQIGDYSNDLPMASISDRSESDSCTNGTRGTPHRTNVEENEQNASGQEGHTQRQHNNNTAENVTINSTSRDESIRIKLSPESEAPILSTATFDTTTGGGGPSSNPTTNDKVAVARLPQSTALEFESGERFDRAHVDRRVNGDGAVGINYSQVLSLNGTGSAIKTPKVEDDQNSPQTILEQPKQQPIAQIDEEPSGSSARAHHPHPHSHSHQHPRRDQLSLQTTTTTSPIITDTVESSAEMQVISQSRGQDSQGYNPIPSVYSFAAVNSTTPYTKSPYNQHMPAVSSLLRPEWRRNSYSEYSNHQHQGSDGSDTSDRRPSFDYDDTHVLPIHRNSLPNLPLGVAAATGSPQDVGSAHQSPSPVPGYYTPGERLVPAAFGNQSSSHGSGSSASSTPPTITHDASANTAAPVYRYDQAPSASQMSHPTAAAAATTAPTSTVYDSPRDQKYEPAYPAVFNSTAPVFTPRGQTPMFYSSYPTQGYAHHYEHRGSSSSPAPPMIAGMKRGREDEWDNEAEASRELQRRRSSYSQSAAMIMGGMAYRNASASPSIQSAEMGVIRVAGYVPPSMKEPGVRDLTGEPQPLHIGIERYANGRRPGEDAIRSGSDTSYSFIALPGNTVRKRPRRKFEEITRNYVCIWPGCSKAYGTLNHLNAHVTMQKHGAKRVPSEFKELRKVWRKQKKEQQQYHHQNHHYGMQNDGTELFHDDERENTIDDDEGSVYNPTVEPIQ